MEVENHPINEYQQKSENSNLNNYSDENYYSNAKQQPTSHPIQDSKISINKILRFNNPDFQETHPLTKNPNDVNYKQFLKN